MFRVNFILFCYEVTYCKSKCFHVKNLFFCWWPLGTFLVVSISLTPNFLWLAGSRLWFSNVCLTGWRLFAVRSRAVVCKQSSCNDNPLSAATIVTGEEVKSVTWWRGNSSSMCHVSPGNLVQLQHNHEQDQDRPGPALTISFIKEEGFKPTFKRRDGVCLLNWNWEMIPQERSLTAEGSGSYSAIGTTSKPEFWEYMLQWDDVVLWWCHIISFWFIL